MLLRLVRQYKSPEFAFLLLHLLRDELGVPGWADLPTDTPSTLLHIHKISGALTNAVFFISIPPTPIYIAPLSPSAIDHHPKTSGPATPVRSPPPHHPLTVLEELERGRQDITPMGTPRPHRAASSVDDRIKARQEEEAEAARPPPPPNVVSLEAPTVLLRVYGPSSGALISRKTELHILHTLSSDYAIGPRVLGTFGNGRIEEYFHSRALVKEEMRDERVSRWIGRRMRELHQVPLQTMQLPADDVANGYASRGSSHSRSTDRSGLERPGLPGHSSSDAANSGASSSSSVFSFGTSMYSLSSRGSSSSLATINSELSTSFQNSPLLLPQRHSSESSSGPKRRSRSTVPRGRKTTAKLGVWDNITRWTREAKLVLKELDQLASLPGFTAFLGQSTPPATADGDDHIPPLSSASRTFALREELNLPLFEQQVKLYRNFVREYEKSHGKSRRVFAHNDAQYGNLLLLTPKEAADSAAEKELERALPVPHHKIIVVDFEYAGANARGYDIGMCLLRRDEPADERPHVLTPVPLPRAANHFIEWQADYHHSSLSSSLFHHGGYPTQAERTRFFRAYLGTDQGNDDTASAPDRSVSSTEELRLAHLEDEVRVWAPASHAQWATWGVVQVREDLQNHMRKWKRAYERSRDLEACSGAQADDGQADEEVPPGDFDYLSYALGRITMFRAELKALGIVE